MSDDLISRQAAIDALDALCDRECEYSKKQRSFMCGACRLGSAFDVIDELPPAQPQLDEEFAEAVRAMFADIWDREIDHPKYQDTVGEILEDVIKLHNSLFAR